MSSRARSPPRRVDSLYKPKRNFLKGEKIVTDESKATESGNGRDKKAWVIARTGDAFRVYAPANPGDVHTVRLNGIPTCTCREYNAPGRGGRVPCIHISVVLAAQGGRFAPQPIAISPAISASEPSAPERRASVPSDDAASKMLLKRSVSPDGRIDSLSVEFSLPVAKLSAADIKASAQRALLIQTAIVEGFRGKRETQENQAPEPEAPDGTLYACIKGVRAMDTKWGRRLYLEFLVNGEHLRLFGSHRKIGEVLGFAGFPEFARQITEGLELDLPCRVIVEPTPDGRYMNVRRVFPAKN